MALGAKAKDDARTKRAQLDIARSKARVEAELHRLFRGAVVLTQYSGLHKTATFYCRKCEQSSEARPVATLKSKTGCKLCSKIIADKKRRLTKEEVQKRLDRISAGKIKLAGTYESALKKTTFKCDKDHTWIAIPSSLLHTGSGCPVCSHPHRFSRLATAWMQAMEEKLGRPLQHGLNGGEVSVRTQDRVYRVDGFDRKTGTVYEFHGDAFHGNPAIFKPGSKPHPFRRSLTARKLWSDTQRRENAISEAGYRLIAVWESDWRKGKIKSYQISPNPSMRTNCLRQLRDN